MLTETSLNAEDYAKKIDKASKQNEKMWQIHLFQTGQVSHMNCMRQCMILVMRKIKKLFDLGHWYKTKNKAIAETRLQQAGVRLAYYLNQLFAKQP